MKKHRRIYKKKDKSTTGYGYWGDYGEIDAGISLGRVESRDEFNSEKLHYHKKGVVYMLLLEGSVVVEIEGEKIKIKKDDLLRISPKEKYRVLEVIDTPCVWIVFCSSKDPKDKVIVD